MNCNETKKYVNDEIYIIAEAVEKKQPGLVAGLGSLLGGAAVGGVISLAALSSAGLAGLSAVGITTGLATLGFLVEEWLLELV